jgi:hypothetical protein
MCNICEIAKSNQSYKSLIDKMEKEDIARMENTKQIVKNVSFPIKCYTSINWPVALYYPFFEARMAYAVPSNYFQNIVLDDERLGNNFSHGSMRSVFFSGKRLMLFSKSVNFKDGKEFFNSFLLLHLEENEYEMKIDGESFSISASASKQMKNLISGAVETKTIRFNFVHSPVKGRIVTKERVLTSSEFKTIYSKYAGGAQMRSASIDLEGYAITVPHFAPHPYMLQLKEAFGYQSNREFQERVIDYFAKHKN